MLHRAASCFSRYDIRDIAIHMFFASQPETPQFRRVKRLPMGHETARTSLCFSPGGCSIVSTICYFLKEDMLRNVAYHQGSSVYLMVCPVGVL
ncbi:hypothetical protein T265_02294 [Opisthorchis viverrini]|uniref:Uncharacterized protein n=1 Tax=Opisthorchis viverrini TaxID=6198 RepID=A0A074ZZT3_OPIVI|nr:hypothetical protein T265_02294 [Opisthorchis viverrini]KER31527.1 hypothetical protein T265_02294 [Opisthorchis viverrini]